MTAGPLAALSYNSLGIGLVLALKSDVRKSELHKKQINWTFVYPNLIGILLTNPSNTEKDC